MVGFIELEKEVVSLARMKLHVMIYEDVLNRKNNKAFETVCVNSKVSKNPEKQCTWLK